MTGEPSAAGSSLLTQPDSPNPVPGRLGGLDLDGAATADNVGTFASVVWDALLAGEPRSGLVVLRSHFGVASVTEASLGYILSKSVMVIILKQALSRGAG